MQQLVHKCKTQYYIVGFLTILIWSLSSGGLVRGAVPWGLTQCGQPYSTLLHPILSVLTHQGPALLRELAALRQTGVFFLFFFWSNLKLLSIPIANRHIPQGRTLQGMFETLWTPWFPEALKCHKGPLVPWGSGLSQWRFGSMGPHGVTMLFLVPWSVTMLFLVLWDLGLSHRHLIPWASVSQKWSP